jgi:hypothetical protein
VIYSQIKWLDDGATDARGGSTLSFVGLCQQASISADKPRHPGQYGLVAAQHSTCAEPDRFLSQQGEVMASTDNQVEAALGSAEVAPEAGGPGDRRAFMKGAVAVATAAVATTTAAAAQEKAKAPGKDKLHGSVHARFDIKKPPTAKQLHETLDRILTLHGCPACGLVGIDIRFRLGDPVQRLAIKGVEVTLEKAATH